MNQGKRRREAASRPSLACLAPTWRVDPTCDYLERSRLGHGGRFLMLAAVIVAAATTGRTRPAPPDRAPVRESGRSGSTRTSRSQTDRSLARKENPWTHENAPFVTAS